MCKITKMKKNHATIDPKKANERIFFEKITWNGCFYTICIVVFNLPLTIFFPCYFVITPIENVSNIQIKNKMLQGWF
jgi:hypothetical protein